MPSGEKGDLYGKPSGVVILSAEDDAESVILPKLQAMEADLNRIVLLNHIADEEDEERPPTLSDLGPLETLAIEAKARLIIVDPFMAFLPGNRNAHRDQDMRAVLAPLIKLAGLHDLAVQVIHHLNKGSGDNPQNSALYRGGGSIGIAGAARSVLMVGVDRSDPTGERRVMVRVKGNLSRLPAGLLFRLEGDGAPATVKWEGETDARADELVQPTTEDEAPAMVKEACEWLEAFLADGPKPSETVYQQGRKDGQSRRTLQRAKKYLGIEPRKVGNKWQWAWPVLRQDTTKVAKVATKGTQFPCQLQKPLRGMPTYWQP